MEAFRKVFAGTAGLAMMLCAAPFLLAQQAPFDGSWQMDAAKSHVNDDRVVAITIASLEDGSKIKMTIKTTAGGQEMISEFTGKFNGKPADFMEGSHKSQLTVWFGGPVLNAYKESGPAGDVSAMWKLELSADKQTLTMTIAHYEPAGSDETLVFRKK